MSQFPQPTLPFGQQPDLSPLRENFAPRMGGIDTSLNQQELQQNRQIGQERLMNQANQLQNAHAMQVAKGQTSTSQSGMGTSPITQSVMKAKQLATSMLDQDNLSDQQKGILRDMQNDPNVDYKTHLQAIDQMRTMQQQGQHQQNFETKNSEMQAHQQQSIANQKQKLNLSSLSKQQSQSHSDMVALAKQLGGLGVDPDGPPNPDAGLRGLQEKYQAAKQGYSTAQDQIDEAHNHYGELPAGGDGNEQDQHGAEFKPGAQQVAADQPGYMSIKPVNQQDQYNTPVVKPGSKGKPTMDVVKQYHQRVGNDPNAIRAAMKADGWSF